MIKFETINGQLCRMLETPIPLTEDAQFPCAVRMIQDDSPMGKHNIWEWENFPERLNPIVAYKLNDDKCIPIGYDYIHISQCEIIGYPVETGSLEWACYQLKQGKMVIYRNNELSYSMCPDGSVSFGKTKIAGNGYFKTIDDFYSERVTIFPTGWKLYEPETKPLAAEGSAEWAWQMWCLLGNEIMLKNTRLSNYADKYLMVTYIYGHDVNYWKTHKDEWLKIAPLHEWKLCKPESVSKQEPKPLLSDAKVGDFCRIRDGYDTRIIDITCHKDERLIRYRTADGFCHTIDGETPSSDGNLSRYDITELLSPFDVVVKIGCMEGTIRKGETCNCHFILKHPSPAYYSLICKDALDQSTREFVEAILKAQEKGNE